MKTTHPTGKEEPPLVRAGMVGDSPALRGVCETIRKVSGTKTTVLIEGESGTGKELVAKAIHENSPWKRAPFISVHCAALSPTLLESELFGHEKGAFTGAVQRKLGRFEMAQGGTLLLDEVSEIPPEIQVKLLRVLQERQFERVGGTESLKVDLRIVASSNRNLAQRAAQGAFREDLYYRLNVVTIHMPPLRDRREDIPLLADYFLDRFSRQMGRPVKRLNPGSLEALQAYPWPGNIRELQNLLEKETVLSEGDMIEIKPPLDPSAIPSPGLPKSGLIKTLEDVERALILHALRDAGGVQSRAARRLEISRSALQYKIAKYHLEGQCLEAHGLLRCQGSDNH